MSTGLVTKAKVTTLDKIRSYYLKGESYVTLSPKQEEIRIHIYKSWNLLINYHSREQAMQVMMNSAFDGKGCSRAQAYRFVNDALSVFGNVLQNQKDAKRYIIEEDLKRLQQRAIKDKDGNLELAVIKQMIKIGGFDKDNDPKFDPEKLKAQNYILKLHPSVISVMEKQANGGAFDFNSLDTEDVDFQEIKDKEEEDEE